MKFKSLSKSFSFQLHHLEPIT